MSDGWHEQLVMKGRTEPAMKLEQLADVMAGITTTPGDTKEGAGVAHRVVQVRNIQEGAIGPAKELKTVYLSRERAERYVIQDGDILVAIVGANPKIVPVATPPKKYLADKGLGLVRPKTSAGRKRILKYLTSESGQERLRSLRGGITVPHMKLSDLMALDIP